MDRLANIDHIVYCVPNLHRAVDNLTSLLGVRPVIGGRHEAHGTKNALLHLGESCYLEILAIDEENKGISSPRWMGVDSIDQPQITRWSLKAINLEEQSKIVHNYHPDMGQIITGQRITPLGELLKWNMIVPLASPTVELVPFFTDWSNSGRHPTDALPAECELVSLNFFYPFPDQVQPIFDKLEIDHKIVLSNEARVTIEVRCPNGLVQI
jgi:hypothetical protein